MKPSFDDILTAFENVIALNRARDEAVLRAQTLLAAWTVDAPAEAPPEPRPAKRRAGPGRRPSPNSAASKVAALLREHPNQIFTREDLAERLGLEIRKVRAAIDQLRHKGAITTPDRGKYLHAEPAAP